MTRRTGRTTRKSGLSPLWLLAGAALLILAGVGLFLASTPNPSQPAAPGTGPRLAVDKERIDLGKQPFEKPVRAEFALTNTGDQSLTLNTSTPVKALEGCWPPPVVVGSTTLRPGQSTTLSTEFTMHEGMGGKHLFEITIKTNDPTQPNKLLYVASDWGGAFN